MLRICNSCAQELRLKIDQLDQKIKYFQRNKKFEMTKLELTSALAILLIMIIGLLVVKTEKGDTENLYAFVVGIYFLAQVFAEMVRRSIQIYLKVAIGAGTFIIMVAKDYTIFEKYISNLSNTIKSCIGF